MKTTVTFTALVVMAMFTGIHHTTASQLEGFWHSDRAGVSIEVEDTYDGIKVKRTDQNRWRYYDTRRNGSYVDAQGNAYTLSRRDQLTWRSRSGRTISFGRSDFGAGNSYDWYDDDYGNSNDGGYYDDGYYDDGGLGGVHPDGSYCPQGFEGHGKHKKLTRAQVRRLRSLEGRWSSWATDNLVRIRVNRKAIHMDLGGRHVHFYPTNRGRFISDSGMTMYTNGRNRLTLKKRRGRALTYTRGRTNNLYCE